MERVNAALRHVPTWLVYLAGALWAAWLFWQAITGAIGVDPVRELEHELGIRGLQLLILGLAITPARRFLGLNLMRFRRAVGLTAFGFVTLHLLAWLVFDIGLDWMLAWADLRKRPYVTIGMLGFALLIPLALTSSNAAIRRLGPRWRQLHRLAYPAGLAGAIHYVMVVKAWPTQPLVYLGLVAGLLLLRLVPKRTNRRFAQAGSKG